MQTSEEIRQPYKAVWIGNTSDDSEENPKYGTEGLAYLETNQNYIRKMYCQTNQKNIDNLLKEESVIWSFDWSHSGSNHSIYTKEENLHFISRLKI